MPTSTGTLDTRFSDPAARVPAYDEVQSLLRDAELYWLTTVRPDGRPCTSPLVGVWHDGGFAFCTGVGEQKQRNLQAGSAVTVVTGTNGWQSGTDVVVEGVPERVLGRDVLEPLAAAWREKYHGDWPWQAAEETFDDGSGSRPWVYLLRPTKVLAFGKDPHSQVRFRP